MIVSPFSTDCGGTAFTPSNEMLYETVVRITPAHFYIVDMCGFPSFTFNGTYHAA